MKKCFTVAFVMLCVLLPFGSLSIAEDASVAVGEERLHIFCQHDGSSEYEMWYTYEKYSPYNPDHHQAALHYELRCSECNALLDSSISYFNDSHVWDNGRCRLCAESGRGR